ncbi:MAG: hypothetical protein UW64_C0003G0018 [Microgenomates group bacterium GW2011_GWC1_44_37]|uniref:Glycosyltransferase RgtA/B/C/D-like domain-containing protein n=1 Tax=Candidatus Collierbacteria bacterium GW2011_GWB2_44_22 TaxID=1618387 RepID=A0A0G1HZP5_9BACT|nr:MAG: hypothetical protein UW31_C0005G0017 [Candidatus Collierbacteria bacterium GW2011_GWA2_44_13]KKT52465.1 MAG: hypothetical protein UW44_C0001G0017 [Candidatus Collierbacteria bacterium GW2011_GWB2_44_22]KKT69168.1 MAG: hypothetical protein UW64_C0003G0018 [Microgenomates group bacterium GW2011_GWC1_44_37]KKT89128.1 MAG: hypothetical protein UW88_C0005G0017 [Candidatus Collierbacteria bacterium GW2011_GWD2_45_10]
MKSITKNRPLLFLLLFTLLGGLLRFWKLDSFPVSLNWDEASHGYNAYSILLTGKDEWGVRFPLIFRAFGDYKLPFYIYLSTIPVWLFGLSAFTVRFVSALAGTLAIPGIYLLTRELFSTTPTTQHEITTNNHEPVTSNFALTTAFLLAVSPWHFFISRPALEANLSLTLIIFGSYFLLKFFHSIPIVNNQEPKTNNFELISSVLLLGLSLHTYNTARVFVPLLVLASFFIFRPSFRALRPNTLALITSLLLALLFSGLVIFQVFLGEGTARYEKLKILSPATVFQIGEQRTQSSLGPLVSKLIHNRPVYFLTTFTKNYLSYFSPHFFSQQWGAQFQFAIPGANLLTIPVFLLAVLGFISYLPRLRPQPSKNFELTPNNLSFLYSWLLLSPVAASLTIDPPQALRPNPMIPAIIIFACLGLSRLLSIIPHKFIKSFSILLALWICVSFGSYLRQYFGNYALTYSSSWQFGYEEVMTYVQDHWHEYDRIFITKRFGEPHIFYAFFNQTNPEYVQPNINNIRFQKSDWYWTDKVDNVYFINDWQIPITSIKTLPLESGGEVTTQRSLLITSAGHVPINAHVIRTVNFLDGSPAFIITSVP